MCMGCYTDCEGGKLLTLAEGKQEKACFGTWNKKKCDGVDCAVWMDCHIRTVRMKLKGLSKRQRKVLDLLSDKKWWETPDIKAALNQDGKKLNSGQVYRTLRALERRGLVISEKPPTWGTPVRIWQKQ